MISFCHTWQTYTTLHCTENSQLYLQREQCTSLLSRTSHSPLSGTGQLQSSKTKEDTLWQQNIYLFIPQNVLHRTNCFHFLYVQGRLVLVWSSTLTIKWQTKSCNIHRLYTALHFYSYAKPMKLYIHNLLSKLK